jgi:SOS regulatory protein LexA
MSDLTPRQTQILRLVQRVIAENGMPPTRAEIARELGFRSPNAAEEHLRALARKGVISLVPGTSRGIQLKDTMREQLGLPLVGRVAAGAAHAGRRTYRGALPDRCGTVSAAGALSIEGRRHEHEERRDI